MKSIVFISAFIFMDSNIHWQNNKLKYIQYEELTAVDFIQAVKQSESTCILPFGVLDKHGPRLLLETDLIDARVFALKAAELEYTIVFPEYYFGQINEAKHQSGTIAYSHE